MMKGLVARSEWMSRNGDAATFVCDLLAKTTNGTFDIDVEHKNVADTTATSAGTFTQITATGIATKRLTGLKEQVRFKFTAGGTADSDWIHFRMLQTVWEVN
jgi:hypothetical protein